MKKTSSDMKNWSSLIQEKSPLKRDLGEEDLSVNYQLYSYARNEPTHIPLSNWISLANFIHGESRKKGNWKGDYRENLVEKSSSIQQKVISIRQLMLPEDSSSSSSFSYDTKSENIPDYTCLEETVADLFIEMMDLCQGLSLRFLQAVQAKVGQK